MYAVWKFDTEDDGRVIGHATVACYGVDRFEAAAECVKHLLVDVICGVAEDKPSKKKTKKKKKPSTTKG